MTETCGSSVSPTRRGVVTAAGGAGLAVVLTACGGGSSSDDAGSGPSSPAAAPTSDAASTASAQPTTAAGAPTSGGASSAAGGKPLGATADIPVGGGKIFADEKVVVTQPTAGQFKAFSAVCTHQGCLVTSVSGGTINCPCHHSMYRVADGSVAAGPAPAPLPSKQVTVSGGQVELA